MGSRALESSPVDSNAAKILEGERVEQGVPKDVLAEKCGVRPTRLRTILSQSRPMTVGELDAIAAALGTRGWRVLRRAEEVLAGEGHPFSVESVTEVVPVRDRFDYGPGYVESVDFDPSIPAAALDYGISPEQEAEDQAAMP